MYIVEKDVKRIVVSNYMLDRYLNEGFVYCRKINMNKTLTSLKVMPVGDRTIDNVIKFFKQKIEEHQELVDDWKNQLNTFRKEIEGLD